MGTVYEAIDLRLRNVVAVKQMTAAGFEADQAFEREAALLASLRHACLPVVIDYFIDQMGRFFVMQYIDGEDLSERLSRQQGPCSVQDVRSWALTLLTTLDYLHSHVPPVVHRDIKPSNLRVTARGELVLLDFGLAKGRAVPHESWTSFERSIFGFTPRYAPPEQLRGEVTTPQTDLYALGATLYHLATGVAPPHAADRTQARSAGLPDPLFDAYRVNPNVPVSFSNNLARALALDPAERFASAGEMRRALLDEGSITRPSPRAAPVTQRRVDAAVPNRAEVGRQIDVIVQVRFADSPTLGLEDWPTRRPPDAIEQDSATIRVVYPIDRQTGGFAPARLRIKIVAPDFVIDGNADRLIDVPPDEYSTRIVFLVSATRAGFCRLNVEVYGGDGVYLGAISLEAEAFVGAEAASELRVAQMMLMVASASSMGKMTGRTIGDRVDPPATRIAMPPHPRKVTPPKSSSLRRVGVTAVVAVLAAGTLLPWWFSRRASVPAPSTAGSQPTIQAAPALGPAPTSPPPAATALPPTDATGRTALNNSAPAAGAGSSVIAPAPSPMKPPSAPILAEEHARSEISRVVESLCAAYRRQDLRSIAPLLRKGDLSVLPAPLRNDVNLRCTGSGPDFDRVDASSAGGAQLHFTMTHVTASNGTGPAKIAMDVVIVLSRRDFQSPWLIDRITPAEPPR